MARDPRQGPQKTRALVALGLQPHVHQAELQGWGAWLDLLSASGLDTGAVELARSVRRPVVTLIGWDAPARIRDALDVLDGPHEPLAGLDELLVRLRASATSDLRHAGAWRVRDAEGPSHGWSLRGSLSRDLITAVLPVSDLPGQGPAEQVWQCVSGARGERVGVRIALDHVPEAWTEHFGVPAQGYDRTVVTELLAHTTRADALQEWDRSGQPLRAGLRLHIDGPQARTAAVVAAGVPQAEHAQLAALEGALDRAAPDALDVWGDLEQGIVDLELRYAGA